MDIKKVYAVFFSATGTTKTVVTEIAKNIATDLDIECEQFDFSLPIARNSYPPFQKYDLIIFGTPVYAGRVPNVLLKYLKSIKGNGAISVPIVVYGNRNYDDALIELRDILIEDGFYTIAAAAFIGEHSFSYELAKNRPDKQDISIAKDFSNKIVHKLNSINDIDSVKPIDVKGNAYPYRGYYQPQDRNGNPIDIRRVKPLTNKNCNNCKFCAEICTMGSINFENVSEIKGICIKCGACIKRCSQHAKYYDNAGYIYHMQELEYNFSRRAEPELFLN